MKLINIKDIQERYKRNPEPQEVTDIRNTITKSFNKLEFEEGPHKYYLPQPDGTKKEYTSVSVFTHQFQKEEDWDDIAARYALKNNRTKEDVQLEWHENNITSTSRGSKTHFYGEMLMNMFIGKEELAKESLPFQYQDGYLIPYCEKEEAILKYYTDILHNDNVYPIMPETKVYTGMNNKYSFNTGIAGTFDITLAMRHNGRIGVCIHDFKTNKDLYSQYNRDHNKTLLEPFDNMVEESFSMYTLQLNMYQLMLGQLDIDIIDRRIIWLKDDGTYEKISVPDITPKLISYLEQ